MRATSLDMEELGNLPDCSVGPSPEERNGHGECRDGVDSRIDGVAKWRMDG
jgi:hypothetical protein